MRAALAGGALGLLLAVAATADEAPGLAVGVRAPAFDLPDQTGERRSLAALLGGGKLAVVFFRSADW